MKTDWVNQALAAGGTLTIQATFPPKLILRAKMSWPGEADVNGEIGIGIESAIDKLNEALLKDAAKEMQEKGAV